MELADVIASEIVDINKIVAGFLTTFVIAMVGLVRWVLKRGEKDRLKFEQALAAQQKSFDDKLRTQEEKRGLEWEKRDMMASRDRHDLRNEIQVVKSELAISNILRQRLEDKLKHTEDLLDDTRRQVELKDREIVKLRDQVDHYTKLLIDRGVKPEVLNRGMGSEE